MQEVLINEASSDLSDRVSSDSEIIVTNETMMRDLDIARTHEDRIKRLEALESAEYQLRYLNTHGLIRPSNYESLMFCIKTARSEDRMYRGMQIADPDETSTFRYLYFNIRDEEDECGDHSTRIIRNQAEIDFLTHEGPDILVDLLSMVNSGLRLHTEERLSPQETFNMLFEGSFHRIGYLSQKGRYRNTDSIDSQVFYGTMHLGLMKDKIRWHELEGLTKRYETATNHEHKFVPNLLVPYNP